MNRPQPGKGCGLIAISGGKREPCEGLRHRITKIR